MKSVSGRTILGALAVLLGIATAYAANMVDCTSIRVYRTPSGVCVRGFWKCPAGSTCGVNPSNVAEAFCVVNGVTQNAIDLNIVQQPEQSCRRLEDGLEDL